MAQLCGSEMQGRWPFGCRRFVNGKIQPWFPPPKKLEESMLAENVTKLQPSPMIQPRLYVNKLLRATSLKYRKEPMVTLYTEEPPQPS